MNSFWANIILLRLTHSVTKHTLTYSCIYIYYMCRMVCVVENVKSKKDEARFIYCFAYSNFIPYVNCWHINVIWLPISGLILWIVNASAIEFNTYENWHNNYNYNYTERGSEKEIDQTLSIGDGWMRIRWFHLVLKSHFHTHQLIFCGVFFCCVRWYILSKAMNYLWVWWHWSHDGYGSQECCLRRWLIKNFDSNTIFSLDCHNANLPN